MADNLRLFKLRNKKTGLFWCGGGYLATHWGKHGKVYNSIGALKVSFRQTDMRHNEQRVPEEDCELWVWETTHPHEVKDFVS